MQFSIDGKYFDFTAAEFGRIRAEAQAVYDKCGGLQEPCKVEALKYALRMIHAMAKDKQPL